MAAFFNATNSGTLEELLLKTGSTANTCTSVALGILTRESEKPAGFEGEQKFVGSSLRPGFVIVEKSVSGTPGTKSTITAAGLNAEIYLNGQYWIVVLPIGGNLHVMAENAEAGIDLAISTAGGFAALGHTTAWEWPGQQGPFEAQGNGTLTSPAKAGANWLGLMGNSGYASFGAIDDFSKHGILFDRGNGLEPAAGAASTGTSTSLAASMKPIIIIEDGEGEGKMPSTTTAQKEFAEKVVETINKEKASFPGKELLFEILNEPYFRTVTEGVTLAQQYADIVNEVFLKCEAAGISLSIILISARGREWITEMYARQSSLKTKIANWSVHPYGPENNTNRAGNWNSAGILSLQALRAEMQSGQSNIYVTEYGWWVEGVNGDKVKQSPAASSQAIAEEWLKGGLQMAWRFHDKGWLKSMIIYSRGAGGFAMEETAKKLTKPGEALINFADEQVVVTPASAVPVPHIVNRQSALRSSYR